MKCWRVFNAWQSHAGSEVDNIDSIYSQWLSCSLNSQCFSFQSLEFRSKPTKNSKNRKISVENMKSHNMFMCETYQKSRHFMMALHLKSLQYIREQFSGFNICHTWTFPATIYWEWSICLKEIHKKRPTKTKRKHQANIYAGVVSTHMPEMRRCAVRLMLNLLRCFLQILRRRVQFAATFCGAFYVLSPWNTKLGIFPSSPCV